MNGERQAGPLQSGGARRPGGARPAPAAAGGGRCTPVAPRVKICGLTRGRDALLAASLGADYLGFVFADSPRRVSPQQAAEIVRLLQRAAAEEPAPGPAAAAHPIQLVGVFVNADRALIRETVQTAGLTMVQLHGDETPGFCRRLDLPVIKALRLRDRSIFDQIRRYDTEHILLESYSPGSYGGSGITADFSLAAEVVRTFPERKIFLAGGLRADNLPLAVALVRPFAVDASSRLESAPGIKDARKLTRFIETAREI